MRAGTGTSPTGHPTMSVMTTDRTEPALHLDRRGARELDRRAIEDLGMPGLELMENAARGVTDLVLGATRPGDRIAILAGPGNNGGDGWAMARMLAEADRSVVVHPLGTPRPGTDASTNRKRVLELRLEIAPTLRPADLESAALVVDALFGTGLDRPLEGTAAEWIAAVTEASRPVVAVDVPSGLDADLGIPTGPVIRADRTVTFVARKLGMAVAGAERYCGTIEVVPIGTPESLLEDLGIPAAG